ncbi:hypothetical protein [Reinekea sp. G2M2-21]|uniref:hypothetical protein n=1 Tax=Reinekea sp. G2M2-21 TaxID=2788942 RepID=UPI0018AC8422|nr:hypothetical protein [Reinekea sp. G2M2-21]
MENLFNKTVALKKFTQESELVNALRANLHFLVDPPPELISILRALEHNRLFAR